MINTPAFESFKRFEMLESARVAIRSEHGLSPYDWLLPLIAAAIDREIQFMRVNREVWTREMNNLGEV